MRHTAAAGARLCRAVWDGRAIQRSSMSRRSAERTWYQSSAVSGASSDAVMSSCHASLPPSAPSSPPSAACCAATASACCKTERSHEGGRRFAPKVHASLTDLIFYLDGMTTPLMRGRHCSASGHNVQCCKRRVPHALVCMHACLLAVVPQECASASEAAGRMLRQAANWAASRCSSAPRATWHTPSSARAAHSSSQSSPRVRSAPLSAACGVYMMQLCEAHAAQSITAMQLFDAEAAQSITTLQGLAARSHAVNHLACAAA